MRFKVPQFLDIEDKIFGPFTFSQFVFLAGGGGLCYILFKLLGFLLGFIPIILVAGFSLALTFYRPNDKPFINMVESGFKYFTRDKLYIWKKEKKEIQRQDVVEDKRKNVKDIEAQHRINNIRLGKSKLRDLAWSLDVLDLKKEEKEQ